MNIRKEEMVAFALREQYERCGYRPYKMNKFEEYDLYVRNKDFLISEGVITFTDTTGKLMALKPDVTLSIIKNAGRDSSVQKVYYNENVYRVSPTAHCFKEIGQMGLECMGDIDSPCIYEVLSLAAASLAVISSKAVLDVSHLGLLSELFEREALSPALAEEICRLLSQKNAHELAARCKEAGVSDGLCTTLCALVGTYGAPQKVLPRLEELLGASPALKELRDILSLFEGSPYASMLRIDLSVVDNIKYYGGIVFKGFIDSIPEDVLSGGQYDKLMKRMGQHKGAIGFAVYLDRLERLTDDKAPFDADTLLLYDKDADPKALLACAEALRAEGSVMLQRLRPEKLRFRRVLQFVNGKAVAL